MDFCGSRSHWGVNPLHSNLLVIPKNQENSFRSIMNLTFLLNLSCTVEERLVIIFLVPHFAPKEPNNLHQMVLYQSLPDWK